MGKEAQHNYSQMISTLKDQHENEAMSLKREKKSLEEELKKTRYPCIELVMFAHSILGTDSCLRDHMMVVQEHLKLCEAEASECSTKLSLMEQKCSQLEKEVETKSRLVLIHKHVYYYNTHDWLFFVACTNPLSRMLLDLNQTILNQD